MSDTEGTAPTQATKPSERFDMPPALVILTAILLLAALATIVLKPGEYKRVERVFPNWMPYTIQSNDTLGSIARATGATNLTLESLRPMSQTDEVAVTLTPGTQILVPVGGTSRSVVVPQTYKEIERSAESHTGATLLSRLGDVAKSPILGFIEKAQIIGFVLLVGGAFGTILSTGAIDRGLEWLVLRVGEGRAKWAVIPISFTLFSLGGAVYGMGEDTIAFVLITVPFALRLGFDTITGVAMCYMASQVGFAAAFFNPFTIGIAQGIAELPYLSGLHYRYIVWAFMTSVGIAFTMWWARRVEKRPSLSPTFAMDEARRAKMTTLDVNQSARPTVSQCIIILVAVGSVFVSGYGVATMGWFINEMASLFVVSASICGLLAGYTPKRLSQEFVKGAATMIEPALIIAFSAGVVIVLQKGQVMDTILYGLATPLESVWPEMSAVAMMGVQAILNFFVPSGSGQAAMTMPLIAPLCDLVGLDRQVGVLAFQFGDGFGNIVIPTSAVLMGVLGAAQIPWLVWVRWVLPLVITLHVFAAFFLVLATKLPHGWLS